MKALPYDRERTSWGAYPMCQQCAEEYRNLKVGGLRRYFYQGISCQHCGPGFRLLDGGGSPLPSRDPLRDAAKLILEGRIVAVKSVGGFHLAALADDDEVVLRLRERKKRPRQPFAVMALESQLEKLVYVDEKALSLLKSPQRPIVLLPKREGSPVSKYVSPGLSVEGVFLPYAAYHYDLLEETRGFLVMTSGNRHGSPTCKSAECVVKQGLADYILDHGLEIAHRVDDSVVRLTDGEPVFLRRSRGYAPRWTRLKRLLRRDVVAFGADLATAGAVGFEDKAVLTQYIGDLDDFDALMELDAELRWFVREYRLQDVALVCDKNPVYNSRRLCMEWAREGGAEVLEVQHHHAHALSAAADLGIDGPFVAVAIDGVGYGDDGEVWGGEVLFVDGDKYSREYHLRYVPMPGGDAATLRPAKMAVAYLIEALGEGEAVEKARGLGLHKGLRGGAAELSALPKIARSSPKTSSVGRFLDAVSAALGICLERTYEGEPAILLEDAARRGKRLPMSMEIKNGVIDAVEFFAELLEARGEAADKAYTAQIALGEALGEAARAVAESKGVDKIVVSGGAAVNDFIIRGIRSRVKALLPRKTPPGDGGIALGQVLYAAYRLSP